MEEVDNQDNIENKTGDSPRGKPNGWKLIAIILLALFLVYSLAGAFANIMENSYQQGYNDGRFDVVVSQTANSEVNLLRLNQTGGLIFGEDGSFIIDTLPLMSD